MSQIERMDDYLGDGVYAHFDGYHINLTTGQHTNPVLVALEPSVMTALKNYEERVEAYKIAYIENKKNEAT